MKQGHNNDGGNVSQSWREEFEVCLEQPAGIISTDLADCFTDLNEATTVSTHFEISGRDLNETCVSGYNNVHMI